MLTLHKQRGFSAAMEVASTISEAKEEEEETEKAGGKEGDGVTETRREGTTMKIKIPRIEI